ncbi:MAG: mandelate racemase/muconate lactonizing enzyme family protein [Thermoleophilia bacterium]
MKIDRITVTPLFLPFKVPYHWAGRLDLGAHLALVEVSTDAGYTGYGESVAGPSLAGVLDVLRRSATLLVGRSPLAIGDLVQEAYRHCHLDFAPRFGNLALAGLEMALWDLLGKITEQPVHRLLGGPVRDHVDYFGLVQGDTAEELADSALELVTSGIGVIYMKVGRGAELDLANLAAVRAVIGGRRLRLDANEAWDVGTAISMVRRLLPFEPEFVEQPTPSASLSALRQVKEAIGVPIAADQAVFTAEDVYEICRERAADLIVLGPHETGGLLAFTRAAAVAAAAGLNVCLHGQFVSGVSDCAQHQVALATPNLDDGNQIMHQLLAEDIISAPDIDPDHGRLGLLDRPGLGFDLDLDAVRRAAERYQALASSG